MASPPPPPHPSSPSSSSLPTTFGPAPSPADTDADAGVGSGTSTPTRTMAETEAGEDATRAEMPMTMAASVVLDHLPKDAHRALDLAGRLGVEKITIHLKSLPNTPSLKQPRFKCDASQNFEYVVRFLRRRLRVRDTESVCCYVNSVFAPALDEGIANLWRCFKIGDELVVSYSLTQAFG